MSPKHPTSTSRRRGSALAVLAVSATAVAGLPAAAHASTVAMDGDTLVVRGASAEKNWLTVGPGPQAGTIKLGDVGLPAGDASGCRPDDDQYNALVCDTPAGVRLEGGDLDDTIDVHEGLPGGLAVTADGGASDDSVRGDGSAAQLLGGAGNDKVHGGTGPETLDGGPGDDEVGDYGGPDTVLGGDGNDKLLSDYWQEQSTDVVDGGAGYDQIEMNWQSGDGAYQPPIDVSIDGVANDGRPDERDNVTGIERIYLTAPATLTGSEGPDELTMFNTDGGGKLVGRGGDDKLSGFDLADTVDGGAGADTIEGGFGDDTITGGPGRDRIAADVAGTSCHWIQCRMPHGNDTIDARDGEADSVDCGVGTDVVQADPIDTLSSCETVSTAAPAPPQAQVPVAAITAPDAGDARRGRSRAVLSGVGVRRRGRTLVVSGRASGAAKVTATATRRGRRVGRAAAAVRSGRFTARLRVRGRMAGLRVTVTAGGARRTLRVR